MNYTDKAKDEAVKRLKEMVMCEVGDKYIGQSVEVSGEVFTSPDILRGGTIVTIRYQVKKIIEDKYAALATDEKIEHHERFSMINLSTEGIVDGDF